MRRELHRDLGAALGHDLERFALGDEQIDGRVATTLAARGARESSAISPKSEPLTSRASISCDGFSSSPVRRRTSSSPRATMYASDPSSPSAMTVCPAGTVIISNAATRSRSASLGIALKSGSGAVSRISAPAASS